MRTEGMQAVLSHFLFASFAQPGFVKRMGFGRTLMMISGKNMPLGITVWKKVSLKRKSVAKFVVIPDDSGEPQKGLKPCIYEPREVLMKCDDPSKNSVLQLAKRCFRPLSHLTRKFCFFAIASGHYFASEPVLGKENQVFVRTHGWIAAKERE